MKPHGKPSADALWELAIRLIEKRTKPGDSIKSILKDLRLLYAGLKRIAPKSISETPLEHVSKWLRGESEVASKTIETTRRFESPEQRKMNPRSGRKKPKANL
jgi:hypothetical protein